MAESTNPRLLLRDRLALAAVLLVSAVFLFLRFGEFPVGAGMDDAYYIETARSLAEGRGPVIHLNDAGPDWKPDIFPLGFPLLLSPLALLLPASVAIFKLVPLLAFAALVPLCLGLVRPAEGRRGVVLAALVCLNPWIIAYAVRVFSDLPFAAVSLSAVLLFIRLDQDRRPGSGTFLALVLLAAAAVMLRSIGLALVAAMVAHWCQERRWRRALLLAGGAAAVLLPHALASGAAGGGLITRAYLDQVLGGGPPSAGRISLLAGNLAGYLKELPVVLVPVFGNPLENLAGRAGLGTVYGPGLLFSGAALLAGVVRGLVLTARTDRAGARFLAVYLAFYGGVLLNFAGYPSGIQTRLLLPVLPLLYLLLLRAGVGFPAGGRRLAWSGVILVAACSFGHNLYRGTHPLNASLESGQRSFIDPSPGSAWIRENTGPAEVIMTRWPLRRHIHFLRPVVGPGTGGPQNVLRRLEDFRVDYVVLDEVVRIDDAPGQGAEAELGDFLRDDPARFRVVHREPAAGITIFSVRRQP